MSCSISTRIAKVIVALQTVLSIAVSQQGKTSKSFINLIYNNRKL